MDKKYLYKIYFHIDSRNGGYIEHNIDKLEIFDETQENFLVKHSPVNDWLHKNKEFIIKIPKSSLYNDKLFKINLSGIAPIYYSKNDAIDSLLNYTKKTLSDIECPPVKYHIGIIRDAFNIIRKYKNVNTYC